MVLSKVFSKYKKYFAIFFLIIVLVSLFGGTYAVFQRIDEAEHANDYKTGNLQVVYSGFTESINLLSAVPMTYSEAMASIPYEFVISNIGNLKYKFNLKLVVDSVYMESHGCAQNIIPSNYIKISINDGDPVLLSDLTDNILLNNLIFDPGLHVKYSIRIWIAEGAPNEIIGKHFHGKIVCEGNAIYTHNTVSNEYIEPNAPVLADGMIPIKHNGTSWVKSYPDGNIITYKLGDVNDNGRINTTDSQWILQYVGGTRNFTIAEQKAADVDGDGAVTENDATIVQEYSVSAITTFPAGEPLEEKTHTLTNEEKWYDYKNKMWANAVMVKSISETNTTLPNGVTCTGTNGYCTREDYMAASVGVTIPEEDILAYFVWIPRYKYQLFNVEFASVSKQLINVRFESGTESTGTETCSTSEIGVETCMNKANGNWYTHPAFTFGDEELQGIWVGKFETTYGTNTTDVYPDNTVYETPTIKPNVTSLRKQQVSKQFQTAQYFGTSAYLTSTGVNEVDAHMMKNIEWGAVAYLKQSAYGLGTTDIAINSYSNYLTGCGPQSAGSTISGGTCNAYHTTLGMSASTTGNITGVYDMSGGAHENVMGVIQDNTTTGRSPMSGTNTLNDSGYIGKLYPNSSTGYIDSGNTLAFPAAKYYDLYANGTSSSDYARSHLGDATGETRSWYGDEAHFPYAYTPWFRRGGVYSGGSHIGVFYFNGGFGDEDIYYGFRVALSTTGA